MDLYITIGQQIKKARKEQGIGQKVLASMLGYTTPTISQYETGKRYILLTDLEKIAVATNRPLTYFLALGERLSGKRQKRIYISLKQYEMMHAAKRLKRELNQFEIELKKQKMKNEKLESKIQNLLARIAEQAQITNQTALLYNELKRSEAKTREAEITAAAYKITKNIAYKLNNPLTGLLGFIQIMLSERGNNQDLKRLESIAKRCAKIIAELTSSFTEIF